MIESVLNFPVHPLWLARTGARAGHLRSGDRLLKMLLRKE